MEIIERDRDGLNGHNSIWQRIKQKADMATKLCRPGCCKLNICFGCVANDNKKGHAKSVYFFIQYLDKGGMEIRSVFFV